MRSPHVAKPLKQKEPKRFGKKEAPSEDGALNDRAEAKSKVMANGRGRRIRHSPGGSAPREEDTAPTRVSQNQTEGGGYGAAHIDKANMTLDHLVSNAPTDMPAMRALQVLVSLVALHHTAVMGLKDGKDRKDMAPRWGELRGQVASGSAACLQTTAPGREEENAAVCRLGM